LLWMRPSKYLGQSAKLKRITSGRINCPRKCVPLFTCDLVVISPSPIRLKIYLGKLIRNWLSSESIVCFPISSERLSSPSTLSPSISSSSSVFLLIDGMRGPLFQLFTKSTQCRGQGLDYLDSNLDSLAFGSSWKHEIDHLRRKDFLIWN
jgi:hypothetical protein